MLVLTRREGEALVIDGDIKVTILSVKGSQVRVGIEAPQNIPIHREELLENGSKPNEKKKTDESQQTESGDQADSSEASDKIVADSANS